MSKPYIHALSSVKKWGGVVEDYLPIHNFLDSSKGAIADNRHRALTHNSWFLSVVLEKVFGVTIINSDNKVISVRDVGEQHVAEDFGGKFIPTAQDYLQTIEYQEWMNNGRGSALLGGYSHEELKLFSGDTSQITVTKKGIEVDYYQPY